MTESETLRAKLAEIRRAIEQQAGSDKARIAANRPNLLQPYLATLFDYDVHQGGFAQLIYNLRGEFLPQTEDMLIAAGASLAQDYYVQAITACLRDKASYFEFLKSDFVSPHPVKDELHRISLDYLARNKPFAAEAASYVQETYKTVCAKP
jgi:hypothetical protein